MTEPNRAEKRAARAFAAKHGVKYTEALRIVREHHSKIPETTETFYCADCDAEGIETVMVVDLADGGHICPICDHAGRVLVEAGRLFFAHPDQFAEELREAGVEPG